MMHHDSVGNRVNGAEPEACRQGIPSRTRRRTAQKLPDCSVYQPGILQGSHMSSRRDNDKFSLRHCVGDASHLLNGGYAIVLADNQQRRQID